MPIPGLKTGLIVDGKLTITGRSRRESVIVTLLLVLGSLYNPSVLAMDPEWQATADIEAVAVEFLEKRIGKSAKRTSVEAAKLDPRHHLAYCPDAMQAFLRRGTEIKARTIVGVRCTGNKPWKVYLSVNVFVTAPVLVAKTTLPKGHVITAQDLMVQERDVSRLVRGYVSDLQQAIGQRLKSQLIAGKILQPALLAANITIRRGQTVTLTAANGSFNISVTGTALTDGSLQQRIQVRNLSSGRVIEGIVRSREHVEILLPGYKRFLHAKPKVSPPLADIGFSNNDR